ncbi:MAG: hypothetical protein HYZ81_21970 [Nitrospinae bacterium]|nr:hypothetical protein [Nitrospinota bacterium]
MMGVKASFKTEIHLTFEPAGMLFQMTLEKPEGAPHKSAPDSGRLSIRALHAATHQVTLLAAQTSPVLVDFIGGFTRWLATKGITVSLNDQEIQGTFRAGMSATQIFRVVRDICEMLSDKFSPYQHSVLRDHHPSAD